MHYSTVYLRVNVLLGSDIKDVCRDAFELANTTGVPVVFDFNGITVTAYGDSDVEQLVDAWQRAMRQRRKIATI